MGSRASGWKCRLLIIDEVKAYIQNQFSPPPDQLAFITHRLDLLGNAVERLGKTSWLQLAIGTFISIGTALALNHKQVEALWQVFKQGVTPVL